MNTTNEIPARLMNHTTDARPVTVQLVAVRVAKASSTLRPEDEGAVLAESRANGCTCHVSQADCGTHGELATHGVA